MIPYDEYGQNNENVIVLLHGAAVKDTFCNQYTCLSHYHLIIPHLDGAGKSVHKVYDPKRQKEELLELLHEIKKKYHIDKMGIIGHSLGAQLAVLLVCEAPQLFSYAVFLSAWLNPTSKLLALYQKLATASYPMLKLRRLVYLQGRYWHMTKSQAKEMAADSARISKEGYLAFYSKTLKLQEMISYENIRIPMLAICGTKETKEMKKSIQLLGKNPSCETTMLLGAGHDFPMRYYKQLNPHLLAFFSEHEN